MSVDPELVELQRRVRELRAEIESGTVDVGSSNRLALPDPVEFVLGTDYLAARWLYPRQATLLKLIFLRTDLFTDEDRRVIAEWTSGFTLPAKPAAHELYRGWHFEGTSGIAPDVLERVELLKARGRFAFREVVAVVGRRGGKGQLGAFCGAYHLARILSMGDPHDFFELPAGKVITMSVFGGNQAQARANQWLDLVRVIVDAPCFRKYVQQLTQNRLVLATPADLDRPDRRWSGSIEIVARETTEIAARGPAAFSLHFDELAYITASTSPIDGDLLVGAALPSMDQFRGYDLIYEASTPAQKVGIFYTNYQRGLEVDPATGLAQNPGVFVIQLPSWGPYQDWERADQLLTRPAGIPTVGAPGSVPETFPTIRRPHQLYDDEMRDIERTDPAKFRVERLAQWAEVMDPYLNPGLINTMFAPYHDRIPVFTHAGALDLDYAAHGDPATRRDRFAWVVGHREGPDEHGLWHAWIDVIRYWSPHDFPAEPPNDPEINFLSLQEHFLIDIRNFNPYQVTLDQYSSVPVLQTLQAETNKLGLPKKVAFEQRPHTHTGNRELAEVFRTALVQGLVHCPYDRLADEELRYLQARAGRVDHPDSGPIQTNDVAISLMVVVRELIGYENGFATRTAMSDSTLGATDLGDPPDLGAAWRTGRQGLPRNRGVDSNPARGGHRRPYR